MSDLMKIGADWGGAGAFKPFTSTTSGAQRTSDAHGRFLDAVLAGRMWFMSLANATPAAYVGGAAGQPLFGIHNPIANNKYFALAAIFYAARGQVTAAGSTALAIWTGASAQPTASQTQAKNALTQQTGSSAVAFANTAMTGSTALPNIFPVNAFHMIGATPVSESNTASMYDIGGLIVASPGNQIAIGVTTVPTGLTVDAGVFFEELPFLAQV